MFINRIRNEIMGDVEVVAEICFALFVLNETVLAMMDFFVICEF